VTDKQFSYAEGAALALALIYILAALHIVVGML